MKISCDNCGAKYSIADEKVRGKVFKIRCKKCTQIVVVRGTSAGAAPDEAAGSQSGTGPIWHLVVGRDQVGPISESDVRARFGRGEIDTQTFAWREGLDDWAHLVSLAEFSDLAVQANRHAASAAVGRASIASAATGYAGDSRYPSGGVGDDGMSAATTAWKGGAESAEAGPQEGEPDHGDLFGASDGAAAAVGDALATDHAPSYEGAGYDGVGQDAGGLFAPSQGRMFPDDEDSVGGGISDAEDEDDDLGLQMTGQRGENSVLFSLANLQSLAMGSASPAVASPAAQSVASDAGSGLIDIRAMAAATTSAADQARREDEDIPPLGGFVSPVAATPVLLPVESDERSRWLLPLLLGVAGLLIATIGVLGYILWKQGASPEKTESGMVQPVPSGDGVPAPPAEGVARPATAPSPGATAPTDTKTGDAEKQGSAAAVGAETADTSKTSAPRARRPGRTRSTRSTPRRGTRDQPAVARRSPVPAPVTAPSPSPAPTRKRSRPRDELDAMIDKATTPRRRQVAPEKTARRDSGLPERLSRDQIMAGMQAAKGRVQSCYDRHKVPGRADVQMKIGGDGRVKRANVRGVFAGTPTGSCVEKAVRAARFPRFKASSMSIAYPFMLR